MEWFITLKDWANDNSTLLWSLGGVSLALLLITPLVVGWLVIRLPIDHFTTKRRGVLSAWDNHPSLRMVLIVGKNVVGAVLLIAGIVMLVAPGQGLLTIVVGILLVDFPGKFRLERWLVTRRQVWRSINWLRKTRRPPRTETPIGR